MKYLFFFGVVLCLTAFMWMMYVYFFVYFDTLLTPKEKLLIYWPQCVLALAGYIIIVITKYKD